MFPVCTPWKLQKTSRFQIFWGGIEKKHLSEMVSIWVTLPADLVAKEPCRFFTFLNLPYRHFLLSLKHTEYFRELELFRKKITLFRKKLGKAGFLSGDILKFALKLILSVPLWVFSSTKTIKSKVYWRHIAFKNLA